MSEEEQEAKKQLEKLLNDFDNEDISEIDLFLINRLIEKQQKEIRELKQSIHNVLDENGITRGYQQIIEKYFDELLEENNNE